MPHVALHIESLIRVWTAEISSQVKITSSHYHEMICYSARQKAFIILNIPFILSIYVPKYSQSICDLNAI